MKIAIIGAGPRGLMMLHRLLKTLKQPAEIDLYDSFQIGGHVWRTDQPLYYLMNSTAQLVTLFNDYQEKSTTGPTFYEWSQSEAAQTFIKEQHYDQDFSKVCHSLQPNDFGPRALFGVYAQWFYQEIRENLSGNLSINFINQTVNSAAVLSKNRYEIQTDTTTITYDEVICSTGTSNNRLTNDEKSLANYADQYNLTYITPSYVNEADLTNITSDQTVLLRGLGLNFFDYLATFTTGRGGKYSYDKNQHLTYQPSGKEPKLVAGSRRGVPYYPKTMNQLPLGQHLPLYFLNWENIKTNLVDQKLSFAKFWDLFQAEIENRYYQLLIKAKYPNLNAESFTKAFQTSKDRKATIAKCNFNEEDLLDWNLLANPVAGTSITNIAAYQKILLQWVKLITDDAKLGSLHAPITGALTIFVDMRTTIQKLVAEHYFTNDDYVNKFIKEFTSFTGFLTSGPPVIRYEQLQALLEAKILTIVPPQLQVIGANHHFIARSHFYPGEIFTCDALIEARLPKTNLSLTNDKLLNSLQKDNIFSSYKIPLTDGQQFNTQAVNVAEPNFNPLDSQGELHHHLFVWGLPITGVEWMTTALPHALSDDRNFMITNQIAKQIVNH
ncbi:FAD/NAD(P)-binding protein [Fructilactobacillus sanfranciscensis]|uniref:FAD/NAD(P)-binding protein n=1 Tax=Fructilactobacillus sanfranciscensis TaxID=1625 RepID=UPI000D441D70|nr:FAD/NAD(P)-binding protein [Fructilactobacillus sanfranciscensis]POH11330.1 hypothetical protein BGL38_06050 [Fructilactobacillus sanfranciscensis]POH12646.1 hypothetical protein BGL40_03805 [Fructilactobacillus sanfranciscensis]POH16597.1 hypothetical protein BGL43_03830 [Fructilactobacillus sanfranciscensis]